MLRLNGKTRQTAEPDFEAPPAPRILVVDDSAFTRYNLKNRLSSNGYDVVDAPDGETAVELYAASQPDAVLLDITMPGMDGYQLCKLLRQNADTANIPIIMLSGKDGFFSKVRGRMAGSTEYLTKPFEPETLLRTIERYCVPDGPGGQPAPARKR